jgi:hypothetical protein
LQFKTEIPLDIHYPNLPLPKGYLKQDPHLLNNEIKEKNEELKRKLGIS